MHNSQRWNDYITIRSWMLLSTDRRDIAKCVSVRGTLYTP